MDGDHSIRRSYQTKLQLKVSHVEKPPQILLAQRNLEQPYQRDDELLPDLQADDTESDGLFNACRCSLCQVYNRNPSPDRRLAQHLRKLNSLDRILLNMKIFPMKPNQRRRRTTAIETKAVRGACNCVMIGSRVWLLQLCGSDEKTTRSIESIATFLLVASKPPTVPPSARMHLASSEAYTSSAPAECQYTDAGKSHAYAEIGA